LILQYPPLPLGTCNRRKRRLKAKLVSFNYAHFF
jgi:hypothetical protein